MRVEYLNEFLELAHTENYQEAAENLFISQATLSKHIQALETEFNLTLFDRTTRSVRLSEDGKFLLQYATKIVSAYDDCKSAIANRLSQKTREHSIRIASTTHIVEYGIADVIADFKRMHYSIKLDVVIVPHNELKPLLRKKKVDFIWIGEPEKESHADSDAFSRIHFHRERLVALIGRASARHYTTPLQIEQLNGEDIIMQDNSSVEQGVFQDFCQQHGFEPDISSVAGTSMQLRAAEINTGIPIMLESLAFAQKSTKYELFPIASSPIIDVNLLYLKHQSLASHNQLFIDYVQSLASEKTY